MKLLKIMKESITSFIIGLTAITIMMAVPSCNLKPKNETTRKVKTEEPHKETLSSYTKFKRLENSRYSFTFEIPEDWTAIDNSDNGDGFLLSGYNSGNTLDMRIYGTHASLMDAEKQNKTRKFIFADNSEGKLFEDSTNYIVEKSKGDNYVIFSVQSENSDWIYSNRELLGKIAKSIKWN